MSKEFVVHYHTGYGEAHYDLMLHYREALVTWQLNRPLSQIQNNQARKIRKIQAHRLIYLSYEGKISGSRGEIKRVDFGTYEPIIIEECYWNFILRGQDFTRHYELKKIVSEKDIWSLSLID